MSVCIILFEGGTYFWRLNLCELGMKWENVCVRRFELVSPLLDDEQEPGFWPSILGPCFWAGPDRTQLLREVWPSTGHEVGPCVPRPWSWTGHGDYLRLRLGGPWRCTLDVRHPSWGRRNWELLLTLSQKSVSVTFQIFPINRCCFLKNFAWTKTYMEWIRCIRIM